MELASVVISIIVSFVFTHIFSYKHLFFWSCAVYLSADNSHCLFGINCPAVFTKSRYRKRSEPRIVGINIRADVISISALERRITRNKQGKETKANLSKQLLENLITIWGI